MLYGNIPNEVLDLDIGSTWDYHAPRRTLRDLLNDSLDEDIVHASWELDGDELGFLMLWTQSEVGVMLDEHGEKYIALFPRNPPA